jgi:glutathione S-transferase kappa 1
VKLELFYDIVSPYSYLALVILDRYRAAWSMELVLRPAWLHGVMKSVGNVPPASLAQRAPYLIRDIGRLSGYVGVELTLPEVFPGNTLAAMRFLRALEKSDHRAALFEVSTALFRAHWGQGRAVDEPATIVELAIGAGLDANVARQLASTLGEPDVKELLKKSVDEAVERGAFGFPAMFVDKDGSDEMFFGHDRLPVLAHELALPWHGPKP